MTTYQPRPHTVRAFQWPYETPPHAKPDIHWDGVLKRYYVGDGRGGWQYLSTGCYVIERDVRDGNENGNMDGNEDGNVIGVSRKVMSGRDFEERYEVKGAASPGMESASWDRAGDLAYQNNQNTQTNGFARD